MKKILLLKQWFLQSRLIVKIILVAVILVLGWFAFSKFSQSKSQQPQYQTSQAEKGTLISSISASGTISAGSTNDITTSASGVVREVYVKNGQTVAKGQKLAILALDDDASSRQTIAWAAYIDALNAEKTAETNKVTTDIQMWKDRQAIFDALDDQDYKNNNTINSETKEEYTDSEKAIIDKTVEQKRKAFEASETAYKNSDAQISKAKAQASIAWRNSLKASSTITAPVSGVVSNFTLVPGVTIASSLGSNSNTVEGNGSNSVSSQKIGSISNPKARYQAMVNLTEIDVIKVNPDQKVTLTLDAFSDKTFTGKVLSIDTAGKVSSGVTTYPTTILLDPTEINIYPNMSVTANIIIDSKTDALLVPNSAIQDQDGQTMVRVINKGEIQYLPVKVGLSSDSQTEIVSGIAEGTEVVTAIVSPAGSRDSSQTSSPFGTMRMGGMGGSMQRQR